MRPATRALILAAWQQRWNRMWRFSAVKPGLWLGLVQVAFTGLTFWRLGGLGGSGGLGGMGSVGASPPLMFIALGMQAGAGSFLGALARGRESLYTARALPLIQISPAPAFSLVAAEVGAELPGRLWSGLLLSTALSATLPAGARVWGMPLLMLIAVTAGALGQMAGLISLMAWVRLAPRSLGAAMAVAMLLYAGLLGYLLYLMATGMPIAAMGEWLRSNRMWLVGSLVFLFGLPGVTMSLWLLVAPDRAGAAYREGWLNLKEFADDAARPRRSWLPALVGGAAGALQAKDWVQSARNKLTLLRLAVWGAGAVGLIVAGSALRQVPADRQAFLLPGLGIGLTWLALGELVGALFSVEGPRIALYVVAGVRPGRLLAGKLLAAAPFALLAAAGTWVAAVAAGAAMVQQVWLALTGGAVGAGMTAIMVGLAAVRITVQEDSDQVSAEMAGVLEQVPRGGWAWAGQGGAVLYGAAGVVVAGGLMPALTPALMVVLLAGPCLALLAGYVSTRHMIHPA